jgi:N-acetylglucosamine transport system permease protein
MATVGMPAYKKSFLYLFLGLYAVLVIYPMLWLVASSLKDSWSIFKTPGSLPTAPHWENYKNAWEMGNLGRKMANSVVVDTVSLVFILAFSSMAAYAMARFRFPGNRTLFYLYVAGLGIPVFLGIVPLFILMKKMAIPEIGFLYDFMKKYNLPGAEFRLMGSYLGIIVLYVAYSLSFTIFILHGFFKGLPGELAEAAAVDGCSPSYTFWRIMLPLAKPGLATAGIFVFIGLWNEYPLALVFLPDELRQTLPVGMASLTAKQKYQTDWGALFAGLTIGVIPTVVLYMIFQKQIQAGLTAGAVKG